MGQPTGMMLCLFVWLERLRLKKIYASLLTMNLVFAAHLKLHVEVCTIYGGLHILIVNLTRDLIVEPSHNYINK